MISKPFSEILKELGFAQANEMPDVFLYQSPEPEDAGAFYRGDFLVENTIAVDEDGYIWIHDGHIDLTQYGFRDVSNPVLQ